MIRVSIITPSYNQAAFLLQTMESVLGQDYPAVEYLVVDGGSTDGSPELINSYADHLAWWVANPTPVGGGHKQGPGAFQRGDRRPGSIPMTITFPGQYRAAVDVFDAHPDVVMVYGNVRAVDENGAVINNLTYDQRSLEDLLCIQIIGQPAVFLRASAVKKVGGLDPRFHFLLDHQLWIRLAAIGRILHVDQTWAAARYHAGAKNRRLAAEFGREAFEVLSWAEGEPGLASRLRRIKGPALAA